MSDLLVVKELYTQFFTYGGIVEALDGVNFTIKEGEVFGLVGESGCGKSVTALSILRLVPPPGRVMSGEVLFKGENLMEKSEREMQDIRGSNISIIFQDPTSSLNPLFKIGYQVGEPLVYHGGYKKENALQEALTVLKDTGMGDSEEKVKNYPHELSGGMRQRAMIAMALVCRPDLLIADEPTTNLDVTIERQIINLMHILQKEYGTSILLITHNLGVVAEMSDRVGIMYAGNIVELTDVYTLFKNPLHPYTKKLQKAIPSATSVGKDLEEIPGAVPRLINPPTGCRFHPRCDFAMNVCSEVKPKETEAEPDHMVACHLYG
ncbi:MAG: ABC transporter ATP-binding protein [Theionarchaea archaeon]|nr:ABC transporter ATP-binding protein [Theionarchaea archaeon]